jgi:hypothetical protein
LLVYEFDGQGAAFPEVLTSRWSMYTRNVPAGHPLALGTEVLEEWWPYHATDLVCFDAAIADRQCVTQFVPRGRGA